jgi:hypothetical protein
VVRARFRVSRKDNKMNQEIYNAQTELKVAQNNYYGSLYDAISAKIDYLKATGKL